MYSSMEVKRDEWPQVGDLVMATVEDVTDYGAYVNLDEYDKKGLLHISEISSSWIRNIRNFIRERQKVVLKVLRVDIGKGHINLSLRRVTQRERIEKIRSWKRERKAEVLLRSVSEKADMSFDEVYEKAGALMEKKYGLYEAFEKAAKEGSKILTKIGVPNELAKILAGIAEERVSTPLVEVKGIVELSCMKPDGVEVIKEAFQKAGEHKEFEDAELRFYVIATPKYRIEVMAENYKLAENALQSVADEVISHIVNAGGHGSFKREK